CADMRGRRGLSSIAKFEYIGCLMLTRKIPSTGEAIPVIGIGTYRGFDVGSSGTQRTAVTDVVRTVFSAGGSVLDSSPMYGGAEEVSGQVLADLRAREK